MTTIKFRRDTSANWTSVNPIPAQGEPCYETDTGKLKIGNGSDNYVTLPYVSDGGGSAGDLPIATATTLGGVKVGDNLSITEDGTLTANDSNYIKTSQVSTGGLDYGVYLNSTNGNKLDTIQPKFNTFDGALETHEINYLKAATYSDSEPADEDMVNNWTDKNGFLTGSTTPTGFISGSVEFHEGSGSVQVVFKLMEAGYISGIDQNGTHKFSKIEISDDGTTYTEYNNTISHVKYIRFTYNYNVINIDFAKFLTRIRTTTSNIAAGKTKALSVKVDNSTIKIVNDKLHANFDGISGEISDVSSRVTSLEGQVEGISTTVDSNTTDIEGLNKTKNDNVFDIGKFTVVGTPTITDDGVVSGFSNSNGINTSFSAITPSSSIIIKERLVYSSTPNTANGAQVIFQIIGHNSNPTLQYEPSTSKFVLFRCFNNSSTTTTITKQLQNGDIIENEVILTSSSAVLNIKVNGVNYTSSASGNGLYCGYFTQAKVSNNNNYHWSGSIDLKHFSITVDGKEVFNGLMNSTKPIYDKIATLNTSVSGFELETSNNFSAVNSALNEKANLSDLSKCASLADFNRLSATVTALESKIRDISAVLNNINGR